MNLKSIGKSAVNDYKKSQALDVILGVLNEDATAQDVGLPSLEQHDRRFHDGRFDAETMHCKLRDDLAKTDKPDELASKHEKAMSGLSNKKTSEYLRLMKKKLPNLDPEETLEQIASISDKKLQGDAFRWLMKGVVRLPEDLTKVREARTLADKAKKDPLSYDTPEACVVALKGGFKKSGAAIDPDTVPELSDKKVLPMGVTTYLVQDDEKGQQAMREIINTHWGKDANPWCLLHGDGEGNLSDGSDGGYDAKYYWKHYSALPKRVAFKDGKLLAFMATDDDSVSDDALWDELESYPEIKNGWDRNECNIFDYAKYNHPEIFEQARKNIAKEQWWDRQDSSHDGIPLGTVKIPNKRNAPAEAELVDGKIKYEPLDHVGERGEAGYAEYDTYDGMLKYKLNKVDENGDVFGFEKYDDGYLSEYKDDDLTFRVYEDVFGDDDHRITIYEDGYPHGEEAASVEFKSNGEPKVVSELEFDFFVNSNGGLSFERNDVEFKYDKDGKYVGATVWDDEGEIAADIKTHNENHQQEAAEFRKKTHLDSYAKDAAELLAKSRQKFRWAVLKAMEKCQADDPKFPYVWQAIKDNPNMSSAEMEDLTKYLKRGY